MYQREEKEIKNSIYVEIKNLEIKLNILKQKLDLQKQQLEDIKCLKDSCDDVINTLKNKIILISEEIDKINDLLVKLEKSGTVYIFWDIENMPIPKNKNVQKMVSNIIFNVNKLYKDNKVVITCYFEKNRISETNMIKLNDNGCQLSYVPNPTRKKERVDMIIIRDLFDINSPDIVGLISSDGDFVPYLKKLEDKGIEVFAITNNYRYDKYISDIIKWENICK